MRDKHEYVNNKLNSKQFWLFRTLWRLRMFKAYYDGDAIGFIVRWWNPLAWIWLMIAVPISILMVGISEWEDIKCGTGISIKPWFKEHSDRLEWISYSVLR